MKPSRRVPALVLTAALGLGIWGLAFTYTPAAFSDGDVLSAAALNALLNDNFQAASDAVTAKVDRDGDNMTGPLGISAATAGGVSTFSVANTGDSGYAALFLNTAAHTVPTVGIKNLGTGPSLYVLSDNGGAFFEGHTSSLSPAISIKADGTIENAVGSGLPLAFGRVSSAGTKSHGTSNWTVERVGLIYEITITGVTFDSVNTHSVSVTVNGSFTRFATAGTLGGKMRVFIYDTNGTATEAPFSFVVY